MKYIKNAVIFTWKISHLIFHTKKWQFVQHTFSNCELQHFLIVQLCCLLNSHHHIAINTNQLFFDHLCFSRLLINFCCNYNKNRLHLWNGNYVCQMITTHLTSCISFKILKYSTKYCKLRILFNCLLTPFKIW